MTDLPGAPPQAPTDVPYTAPHASYAPPAAPYPPPPYATQPPYAPAPPFAPRGPFVPPPPMPPTRQFTPGPPAPRPPKVRSRLGRLTFSLVLVAIGILAALDFADQNVPVGAYLATALGVVALGLILGTWAGRARGLIAFGIVLSVALASAVGADRVNRDWAGGTTTYIPSTLSQVERDYSQDVGDVRLDLSKVDFSTSTVATIVSIRVDAGTLTIILPPNVDVVIDATADAGNVDVLGQSWSGLGLNTRTVTDNGADGVGGGQLHLSAAISVGNLEVHR